MASETLNSFEAALQVVDALRRFETQLNVTADDPLLSHIAHPYNVNIGTIAGGDWVSSVPAVTRLGVRIGFPRSWTVVEAEQRVRDVVAEVAASDDWTSPSAPTVRSSGLRAEGYALPADHPLVTALSRADEQVHGHAPGVVALNSTTDARFWWAPGCWFARNWETGPRSVAAVLVDATAVRKVTTR